jgi:hypothetical protein
VLANNAKLFIESTIIHNTNIKLGKTSSKKFIEITFKFIPSKFSSYKVFLSFKLPINIITVGQKPFFSDNKKKRLYNSLITHFKPLVSDNNFLIKGTLTQYET